MSDTVKGLITKGVGGAYSVCIDGGKERAACQIRGGLRLGGIVPQAGDRVTIEPSGDPDLPYVITKILPRKNNLVRPPVANVDYLILTFSVTDPEPDLKLLDKLLIISANLDITPLIVFTKEDLGKEAAAKYYDAYSECGYKVFVSSKDSPVTAEDLENIFGKRPWTSRTEEIMAENSEDANAEEDNQPANSTDHKKENEEIIRQKIVQAVIEKAEKAKKAEEPQKAEESDKPKES